jgi:FMN phosphatase YigB (HAD superfamily)/sugar phosphate isomerase/epimerase
MKERIEAVLFDMGGTLRSTTKRLREVNKEKIHEMIVLLNVDIDEVEFTRLLKKRARAYKDWTGKTLLELNEVDLWRRWMLPDWPSDQVSLLAPQLSQLWRDATGKHVVFPETRETVSVLFRRGYHLGLVSNTTSSIEVPHLLEELGIAGCFDTIILSCVVGIRKPDPSILLIATERMGVRPENCAYIGDQPCRDVAAARKAGFGQTVILRGIHNHPGHPQDAEFIPDHTIDNLKELLVLFPARHKAKGEHLKAEGQVYDASFSTMWANGNFPILGDFFLAAQRFGFSKIELNHQINSGMLSSVDLNNYEISGIHEPCPADISVETLKARDWMISSPDEDCRQQGVAAIKRSIELAGKLSVRTVVVHAGHVSLDMVLENKLRQLFQAGLMETAEYREIQKIMMERRLKRIGPCLDAVGKSLKELLKYASRFGVCLGLENRYHYFDIPTQDEMSALLALAEPDRLGFIYDVGHATVMDRLGFFPNEMWLKRFGGRIFGAHLHDVIGISDHHAPGLGDVDFRMVAGYLPQGAFRTIEVISLTTPEQIKTGLKKLVDTGCVNLIQ